jgi:hypothetical protein
MNKKIIIFSLFLVLLLCLVLLLKNLKPAPQIQNGTANLTGGSSTSTTNMANPASVYCLDQGGKLSIRKDSSGGEYGICVFDDGSECDEWKFFRKECTKGMPVDGPVVDINKDTELIKLALVQQESINLQLEDVVVTKDTGKYASGSIKPKEEGVGGAYFFAAKISTGWTIVVAGNGTISCAKLQPYPDLPVDMIPECIDPVTGNPVQR